MSDEEKLVGVFKMMFDSWTSKHVQQAIDSDYKFALENWNHIKTNNRLAFNTMKSFLKNNKVTAAQAIKQISVVRPDLKETLMTTQGKKWVHKQIKSLNILANR